MTPSLQTAKKILLVAPHRLGDSLFATPGIRALKQAKPEAVIDVVAMSNISYELFQHNSCINQVLRGEDLSIEKLASNYDIILPLQNIKKVQEFVNNDPKVLMLPRYTGAFHYSQNFYRFVCENLPEAQKFPIGNYELNFNEQDAEHADKLLKVIPKSPEPFLLALHMGCHRVAKDGKNIFYKIFPFLLTKDSRSWSFRRFDQLIQLLLKKNPNLYVVLTGTTSERVAADSLKKHPRILNFMGNTNVTQLAALLKRCNLLVTGDTGPLHVASAVGLRIVLLCGMTDPEQTGPYPAANHTIIQKNGMQNISVEDVFQAIIH